MGRVTFESGLEIDFSREMGWDGMRWDEVCWEGFFTTVGVLLWLHQTPASLRAAAYGPPVTIPYPVDLEEI